MQLIPAVDVLGGQVVRLVEGDYARVTVYADDPVAQAAEWVSQGAALVHVVDLDGARDGSFNDALWRQFVAEDIPFQVGGGIRTVEAAERAVAAGASRVVLGTAAVWHPEVLAAVVEAVGTSGVVAALDVRHGRATGAGWLDEGRALDEVVADVAAAGVVRALVTGIGRDGTMRGPDLAIIEQVRRAAPAMAILGSGGVGSLEDLVVLADAAVEGAIVGRAIYEGRFTVADAVTALAGG